jgi:hypothetical protein
MATRPRRYEDTMRLTLPFARPTRTTSMASGLVHESMFLGRRSEPTAILDRHGSCYLSAAASWGSRHS